MLDRGPRTNAQTDLHYRILGWKDFQVRTSREKHYLAVALRITNESRVRRLLDLPQIRLRTSAGRECVFVAALPDRPADHQANRCLIEAGASTIVTLAFMVPEPTSRPILRLARGANSPHPQTAATPFAENGATASTRSRTSSERSQRSIDERFILNF